MAVFPSWADPMFGKGSEGLVKVNGHSVRSGLQSVYEGLVLADRVFLVGFKIEANGVNVPQVVSFSLPNTEQHKYWKFETPVQGIFLRNEQVTLNDIDGGIFAFKGEEWMRLEEKWPPNSRVVWSDGKGDLIVCHRAGIQREDPHVGACFSTSKHWQTPVVWLKMEPKVCGAFLHVFDESSSGGVLRVLSKDTGKELRHTKLRRTPSDLCRTPIRAGR